MLFTRENLLTKAALEEKPWRPLTSSRYVLDVTDSVVVFGLLALAALLVFALWVGPSLLTQNAPKDLTAAERLKASNDVRTALVATIVALGALGGLVFTGLNLRVNQRSLQATYESVEDARSAQRASEEAQRETLRLQHESQIAERYGNAIELLGNLQSLDVRTELSTPLTRLRQILPSTTKTQLWSSWLRSCASTQTRIADRNPWRIGICLRARPVTKSQL